jgi:putative ABC transport system permease protein
VTAARKVAVANQTFVKKFFGNENPIGRSIRIVDLATYPDPVADPAFEIIGIVADAKNQGLQDPAMPELWIPYTVTGFGERGVLVRTSLDPMSLLGAVRKDIWAVDRNIALTLTGTLEDFMKQFSYSGPRFGFLRLGICAQRAGAGRNRDVQCLWPIRFRGRRTRSAYGWRSGLQANVVRLVLCTALELIVIGLVIGLPASLGLTRLIKDELWGVSAFDPATFGSVGCVVAAVGVAACLFPARRATKVDPLVALRYE